VGFQKEVFAISNLEAQILIQIQRACTRCPAIKEHAIRMGPQRVGLHCLAHHARGLFEDEPVMYDLRIACDDVDRSHVANACPWRDQWKVYVEVRRSADAVGAVLVA